MTQEEKASTLLTATIHPASIPQNSSPLEYLNAMKLHLQILSFEEGKLSLAWTDRLCSILPHTNCCTIQILQEHYSSKQVSSD